MLFRSFLRRLARGEHIDHYETVRRRRDGQLIDVSVTLSPLRDASGTIIGASKIARDITERRRAEADYAELLAAEQAARMEAERATRTKDEFLATVSHELRTPLNVILGWARLLRSRSVDSATTDRALGSIERNAQLQVQLIEDLLDVSRILSGKLRLRIRPMDMTVVVEAARELVDASARAKDVLIATSVDEDARSFTGDPDRLQQVLWNLLANAVRFTPPGGRIDIALRRTRAGLRLSVSDTGHGIAPDLLPHVFERYRQAPAAAGGGLGLGLAIVRHLVQLHGGSVSAFSEGEGRGATFAVTLPFADGAGHEPVASTQGFPSLTGIRVLLVEDDRDARALAADILRRCGGEVVEVETAAGALAALGRGPFHVLVSDIGLPDRDGYALIRSVRALPHDRGGAIPALAVTALAREEDRRRALASGYHLHLAKPVEPLELTVRVAELVGLAE